MNYRVVWEIDIEADSPIEAAEEAYDTQRSPASTATVFDVFGEDGTEEQVDVAEDNR